MEASFTPPTIKLFREWKFHGDSNSQTLLLLPCYLVAFYTHSHYSTETNIYCVVGFCSKKARTLTTVFTTVAGASEGC